VHWTNCEGVPLILSHDFDHPGHPHPGEQDPDRKNIRIAIAGLRRHITAHDRASLPEIEALVEATHFPYKTAGEELDLLGKILRDADLTQVLSPVLDSAGRHRLGWRARSKAN
jgi:hypothetical protein